MKKVGIITFHQAINYGAVLQAYALKEVCEELGYEAHIVNYAASDTTEKPKPIHKFMISKNKKVALLNLVRSLMSYIGDQERWRLFYQFRKEFLSESVLCTIPEEIIQLGYDVYISGSDQIWNYKITGNYFDPVLFGEMNTNAQQVVYAASSHDTPFPLDMEFKFKDRLEKMPLAVSIREKKLADYVCELIGVKYPVVLDPTLLAGREIFEKIPDMSIPKKPYILIYQIDSNPACDITVRTLEKRFKCDVYTMTVPRLGSIHGRKGIAGPEKFLSLLKGADFLVTNSFHGIALSLLFEKQFYVYENGGVMTRIDGLLSELGLLGRKINNSTDIDRSDIIDYKQINFYLDKLRNESRQFLLDGLKGNITEKKRVKDNSNNMVPVMDKREKKDCCGCSACADCCPVNAIEMKSDEEGFLYPYVKKELCIQCGRCDRVCGFVPVKKRSEPFTLPKAYGVKHLDNSVRISSRSGAAFIAFSDIILKRGGVVYGAVMQDDFTVRHMRATNKTQRDKMKKAKYVQSSTTGIYSQVGQDLKSGKNVLFSGTPCQVAGLRAYIKEMRVADTKLYCCDLVCHGVPSPAIWKDYISYIQNKYKKRILKAEFRDKEFGWDSHCESFVLEDTPKKVVSRDYTDLFYDHIMFRPSCYNCQFANVYRPGDLTLADFWGIEKNDTSFNDNRGVSLVLVNTVKGIEFFEQAKKDFEWFECKVENCIQPTLVKSSNMSPRREAFWKDYRTMEFSSLIKKYTKPLTISLRLKRKVKNIMYQMGIRKHP
ncbi:polysaccharide pyruvyl transferase family protein [Anaerostipes faecalis]|uniref:polysaccharide pyruvyl transferase family protein n=1 Tax=Anaerostipes faecalis TaxID=2738446 RepID=UPI003EFF014D